MENRIFIINSLLFNSIAIRDNELWVSTKKEKSIEKFDENLQKTGIRLSGFILPFSDVLELSYNESSESVKLKYRQDNKEKKLNMGFGDVALSNEFAEYLGSKLAMNKSIQEEKPVKPLLLNSLYLLLAIGGTVFLASMADDTSALGEGSSVRSRRRGTFLKMIVDTLGQTGVIILGTLLSLFLAYNLYKRFKNPSNEIVYTR